MFEGNSLVPSGETHSVFRDRDRAVSIQHTPRQNGILAALPVAEYQRLLPNLKPIPLPRDWTVHRAGDREPYLYFITEGIVSQFYTTKDGMSAELAATGSEGVVGVALILGGKSTLSETAVLSAGYAYRLRAGLLQDEIEHGGALLPLLLRYTQAVITQTAQNAACNRHHSLIQHLSRWILSCLDRLPSNELTMTQERIARLLGVRREGVTEAAGKLQQAGLIHLSRGRLVVLDRPRLEAEACECYAVVKHEYDRLLGAQTNIRGAGVPISLTPMADGMKSDSWLIAHPLSAANRLRSVVPREGQLGRTKGTHERHCAGH